MISGHKCEIVAIISITFICKEGFINFYELPVFRTKFAIASLGWVSSRAATEGVTPIFT